MNTVRTTIVLLLLAAVVWQSQAQTTWTPMNDHWRANGIIDLTVGRSSSTSPDMLYAADSAGLYKSANSANEWTQLALPVNKLPLAVVCDFGNPLTALAGVRGDAQQLTTLFRTTNGGQTWLPVLDNPNLIPACLSVSQADRQLMFAGFEKVFLTHSMYRSSTGGLQWTEVEYFIGRVTTDVNAVATLSVDRQRIWAGGSRPETGANKILDEVDEAVDTVRGVFHSTDAGLTWRNIGLRSYDILSVGAYEDGGVVHLWTGTKTGLLRYSSNNGTTWTTSNNWGLSGDIDVITDIKTDGYKVYLATDDGVWVKNGQAWDSPFARQVSGMFDWDVKALAMNPQQMYAGCALSIFSSGDGAATWVEAGKMRVNSLKLLTIPRCLGQPEVGSTPTRGSNEQR